MKYSWAVMWAVTFMAVDSKITKDMEEAYKNCIKEQGYTGYPDGTCSYGENNKQYVCSLACMGNALKIINNNGELEEDKIAERTITISESDGSQREEELKKVKPTMLTCLGQAKDLSDNGPDCNGKLGGKRIWTYNKCMCEKLNLSRH